MTYDPPLEKRLFTDGKTVISGANLVIHQMVYLQEIGTNVGTCPFYASDKQITIKTIADAEIGQEIIMLNRLFKRTA
jgi:hypothetical protein